MEFSLFFDDNNQDSLSNNAYENMKSRAAALASTQTPTRSLSAESSLRSSLSSSSSIPGINPRLKEEQHKKLMISMNDENFFEKENHSKNSVPIDLESKLALSKSPNINSFYFFNDDEDDEHKLTAGAQNNFHTYSKNTNNKEGGIELDSVKHKLSSIWNNMKYGNCIFI